MISYNIDIYDMISYMISLCLYSPFLPCTRLAAVDSPPEQRADATDDDHDPDRPMDFDAERDFADQGTLTDMGMEEDAEILALLLKHIPSCIAAEQLVRDIPVQQLVRDIPVRELYSGKPKA